MGRHNYSAQQRPGSMRERIAIILAMLLGILVGLVVTLFVVVQVGF
jgi:hypothetical protein